ncbi:MAG: CcoQ/FixQ family Cbb3-type cytochrome c oxidase assembly chaperone [Bacteriovoracaceae bacterium]|jgi:cbb3-type cytochrome oxidase subunit 3|nr:CcoQ/FixQ family Cbb3-type cytochrome c oxidase assembly chaperone [Bacteriovoracaceae bacterium]
MKSAVLAGFNQTWLTSLALLLFLSIFLIMLFYIFRKNSGKLYNEVQNLPLNDGEKNE